MTDRSVKFHVACLNTGIFPFLSVMFYLLTSVLCTAGTLLILRAVASQGMDISTLNFMYRAGMGGAAVMTLVASFSWQDYPALWLMTWPFILPGIVLVYLTGVTSINSLNRGHIGVSTMVVRSSILLPVSYVLFRLHQEDPAEFQKFLPLALFGCLSILGGFACFGFERGSRQHSDSIGVWVAWLVAAFFVLGSWDILVAMAADLTPEQSRFCFCITSLGAALVSTFKIRPSLGQKQPPLILLAMLAGLLALLVSIIRPLAVKDLGGLIVFPASAIGVAIIMQIIGAIVWKQRIGIAGIFGMLASAVGITILVYCRS